jgi:hypothetical protein
MREKRGEVPLFTFGEVPEPIGIVAEWYRAKSQKSEDAGRIETDKSLATAEHPQTQQTGASSTLLPV